MNNHISLNRPHIQLRSDENSSNNRLSADRDSHSIRNNARSFESMLSKTNAQSSFRDQTVGGYFDSDFALLHRFALDSFLKYRVGSVDLRSGVGAKALHDLQHVTGPLTRPQVQTLLADIQRNSNNIASTVGTSEFNTLFDQLQLATFVNENFSNMEKEDGKPGLSAEDIRRAAAKDGNPDNLSSHDASNPRTFMQAQQDNITAALNGEGTIALGFGVGGKALNHLQNITGPLTHQQVQTLQADILRSIQHTLDTDPLKLSKTQLDQLTLVSMALNGFDRIAAEDGIAGLSAEDIRRTAAKDGHANSLSAKDAKDPRSLQQAQNDAINKIISEPSDVHLGVGTGAKALDDLQHVGPRTRQQLQTLQSDLVQDIRLTMNQPPSYEPSREQVQLLSLYSLLLKGFDRNAAEDGKPGLSAEDVQQTATRGGLSFLLSSGDVS